MKVLVRLAAEMVTKSNRIRARFQNRLIRNMKEALDSVGAKYHITNEWSRIFVDFDCARPEVALDALSHVFGIGSISPIEYECEPDLDEVVKLGEKAYKDIVENKSFAVRCHRSGRHKFTSLDVNVALGGKLAKYAKKVDLTKPEVQVFVELRPKVAYLFSSQIKGPGGYPLGVAGRALCLFSGGFDSAVAAWLVQKRGAKIDYLFCNLAGQDYLHSVLGVAKLLAEQWSYGSNPKLYVLDFQPLVEELKKNVKPSYLQVILKRFFYRAADKLANYTDADAIITGEAIGQVSSQTLPNLRNINEVATRPVLRPVITYDKDQIFHLAQHIGTYELSSAIKEYCGIAQDKPITIGDREITRFEEQMCDLNLIDEALKKKKRFILRSLSLTDIVDAAISVREIPKDSAVIDCRPAEQYQAFHHPGAQHLEFRELLLSRELSLPKDRTYTLYCQLGLKSAVAAEKMRKNGYTAYSLEGGVKSIRSSF